MQRPDRKGGCLEVNDVIAIKNDERKESGNVCVHE